MFLTDYEIISEKCMMNKLLELAKPITTFLHEGIRNEEQFGKLSRG